MSSRAQRRSAAETPECRGARSFGAARLCIGWTGSEETLVIEGADIGTPEVGIGVHDHARHEDHTIFFEQVFVFQEGVAHDLADGSAEGVPAQDFLECGAQNWAVGAEPCDIKIP